MGKYRRFHPDLWTTAFNFEALGVVVSESETSMRVAGNFRTHGDYIGLIWNSEDFWNHNYVRYAYRTDYSGVKFSFKTEYSEHLTHFNDLSIQPALVIRYKNEYGDLDEHFVTLGLNGTKHTGSDSFKFNGQIKLSHQWIDPDSLSFSWVDDDGNERHEGKIVNDFDLDFVHGIYYTVEGAIPYNAQVTINYLYNTHEKFTLDFNNLYEGTHPSNLIKLSSKGIETITIPIMPENYTAGELTFTGSSDEFDLIFTDMEVVNGEMNETPTPLVNNPYRIAEGFDDENNKNPKRLIESMSMLGYKKIVDFYIGASHFYDKWGQQGKKSQGVSQITLDQNKGINHAFRVWLEHYLLAMKQNDFQEIVISISMECLQMPDSWKQRMWDGKPGQSGWSPPTSFYSPTNKDVQSYIKRITQECLNIVIDSGIQPILQLGESWWWWQEFAPGDVNTPYAGRPPCFYDESTKARFRNEMGYDLPIFKTSTIDTTDENWEVAKKLQQYLGEYTLFMKEIAASYEHVQFTTLFFPPSVLDTERVPEVLQQINYPVDYWKRPNLDFIQIEDYDWVTSQNELHTEVFKLPHIDLHYPFKKQHYFSGFVLNPEDANEQWPLIEKAAQEAVGRNYAEVFIWAGTQIRRDNWNPLRGVRRTDNTTLARTKLPRPQKTE